MSTSVKFYDSTMQGAPQLTNDWGCMTTLLDAILVTGFNTKSVNGLTSADGIATATVNAGHLYRVDQVLTIAGADQAAYNGEVRVIAATSTTFTYAVSGTPTSPATGTISAKVAPLGWEIAFTGTNKRAYRSLNVLSNRPYLRVDDGLDPAWTTTYAKYAKVTMAEGMSDIDTFVGARAPFDPANPTKNEVGTGSGQSAINGWFRWYYARAAGGMQEYTAPAAGIRTWVLVGDDRGFYLFAAYAFDAISLRAAYAFTDFDSFRLGDGFNTLLSAKDAYVSAYDTAWTTTDLGFTQSLNYDNKIVMRDHTQIGSQQRVGLTSLNTNNGTMYSGRSTGIPWPNPSDYGLILHPVYVMQEGSKGLRGKMPGLMWIHNDNPLSDLSVVDGVAGYAGRKFLLVNVQDAIGNSRVAFDITGPWW